MANEHIRTAAANLQRAAQDVRQTVHSLENDLADLKRNAADSIKQAQQQSELLRRKLMDKDVPEATKIAIGLQLKNLSSDIDNIKKDADQREQSMLQRLSGLSGQENEFNNLASHLNGIA